jgi:hypothetical protein
MLRALEVENYSPEVMVATCTKKRVKTGTSKASPSGWAIALSLLSVNPIQLLVFVR